MKKYKHKITGLIINETHSEGYTSHEVYGLFLTKGIVENSQDWEEITEVLLTTEDGVEITDEKFRVTIVDPKDFKIKHSFAKHCSWTYLKYFSNNEAAEQYIEEIKPKYSEKDMINFANFSKNYASPSRVSDAFNKWKDEK